MKLLMRSLVLLLFSFIAVFPAAFAAEPLSGKTVYVDAGHGGEDSGAVGNGLDRQNRSMFLYLTLQGRPSLHEC